MKAQKKRLVSAMAIAFGIARIFWIEAHLREKERGHQVGHRTAARRVAAASLRCRTHRIHPEPRCDIFQLGNQGGSTNGHGPRSVSRALVENRQPGAPFAERDAVRRRIDVTAPEARGQS